jgi:hypothetical protein
MFIFFETSYAVVNLMVYGKSDSGLLDAAFLFYQSNTSFFLSLDLKGEPESYKYLFRPLNRIHTLIVPAVTISCNNSSCLTFPNLCF